MTDPRDELPRTDQPLHGERRPRVAPLLAVVGLILAVAVIFAIVTVLRYQT
jgi:hypothetical protein